MGIAMIICVLGTVLSENLIVENRTGTYQPSRATPLLFSLIASATGASIQTPVDGMTLRGRVIDEQSRRALSGVSIEVMLEPQSSDVRHAIPRSAVATGADGHFVLDGIPGIARTLVLRKSGYLESVTSMTALRNGTRVVEIAMTKASGVAGIVISNEGQPLANATVIASSGPSVNFQKVTDETGAFSFPSFDAGSRVALNASAENYTAVRNVINAPDADVRVVLRRLGRLSGVVVDAQTRLPLTEFSLEFQLRAGMPLRTSGPGARDFKTTDGRFTWERLAPGEWTVRAQAPGYQSADVPGILVDPEGNADDIWFALERGLSVTGRVINRMTGLGVPRVRVAYEQPRPMGPPAAPREPAGSTVVTDGDGAFVLDGLPEGRLSLVVPQSTHYSAASVEVDVRGSGTYAEIPVSSGGTIQGTVMLSDRNSPASGATVELWEVASDTGRGLIASNTGKFMFDRLRPGIYRLTAESRVGRASNVEVAIRTDEVAAATLVMRAGGTVRGHVEGLLPGEIGRVTVSVHSEGRLIRSTNLEPSGDYELWGVFGNGVDVIAETALERRLVKYIERTSADAIDMVDFLFPSGSRLSGRVSRGGRPVPFVVLTAAPLDPALPSASGESFQSGSYSIDGLADGDYVLAIKGGGSRQVSVRGDTVFDIELPEGVLTGRVLDSGRGEGIDGATIRITQSSERVPAHNPIVFTAISGLKGDFRVLGLPSGSYEAIIVKAGYEWASMDVAVSEGSETSVVVVMVASNGARVRVRDKQLGLPLRSLFIDIPSNGTRARVVIPLTNEGLGELPPTLVGRQLLLSAPGYAPTMFVSTKTNNEPVDVWLSRGGRLRLHVGAHLVGRTALLSGGPGDVRSVHLFSREVTLDNLAQGQYTLSSGDSGTRQTAPAGVEDGQTTVLVIE